MELKVLRRRLKEEGYKIKTKTMNTLGGKRFGDIHTKDGDFVVGSSASAYIAEELKKHQVAFDIYNEAKEAGVTDKGTKIIL